MLVRRWQNIKFTILLCQVTFLNINYFIFVSFCRIFMSKQFLLCQCDFCRIKRTLICIYASPKVTKYQVYHSFMSRYIFIHQLFYIRVILSYIYVKTISSVSVWFLPYQATSYMHQINHCFIHEAVNIFISSCVHVTFLYIKKGEMSFWSEVPSKRGVWELTPAVYHLFEENRWWRPSRIISQKDGRIWANLKMSCTSEWKNPVPTCHLHALRFDL